MINCAAPASQSCNLVLCTSQHQENLDISDSTCHYDYSDTLTIPVLYQVSFKLLCEFSANELEHRSASGVHSPKRTCHSITHLTLLVIHCKLVLVV